MPKQSTEYLIQLVSNLTSAEKRNFRLFVNRNNSKSDKLFVQLFDALDKSKKHDDQTILAKIPTLKPIQLSNVKANLYRQLLSSLRHIERNNQIDIAVRENLDYSKILYSKGLYKASLALLDKTKKQARQNGLHSSALVALEFEKYIESQYVTGSMYPKAKQITDETDELISRLDLTNDLSNLSISMYALYLQYGHVKRGENYDKVTNIFKDSMPPVEVYDLDFYQKLYLFQSYVWYNFMIQDFPNNYRYAQKWVDLFREHPEKITSDTAFYIKGLHNVLSALFMAGRYDRFTQNLELLNNFSFDLNRALTKNEEGQLTLYQSIHAIHLIFLTGLYDEGAPNMLQIEKLIEQNKYEWDLHKIMVIRYKIACIYFGANKLDRAINLLNKITTYSYTEIREDIQCYSRILSLVCHFDLGNEILVSYQVKSVYRFLLKTEQQQEVLKEIFKFLRKTPNILPSEINGEFKKLRDRLLKLQDDPFERRPFLYFDIISWLESKINNSRIQTEIKKKIQIKSNALAR